MEGNVTFMHIFENQVSKTQPNFRIFCEFFRSWRKLLFQKPLENFLCVACVHSECVKCCPSPEECSTLGIVTIQQQILTEIEQVKGKTLKFLPS